MDSIPDTAQPFTHVLSTRVPPGEALPPRQGATSGGAPSGDKPGRRPQKEELLRWKVGSDEEEGDSSEAAKDHHPCSGLTKDVKIKQKGIRGLPEAGSSMVGLKPLPHSLPQWHSLV